MAAKTFVVAVPHHLIFLLAGQTQGEEPIRLSIALPRAVQFLGIIGRVGIVDQYELQHHRVAQSLQLRYLQLYTRSFTVRGRDRWRCCGWCRRRLRPRPASHRDVQDRQDSKNTETMSHGVLPPEDESVLRRSALRAWPS